MSAEALFTLLLCVGALLLMALSRFKPHIIMLGVVILLSITGVLTTAEAFAGFSNSGMITVAAMFVVAAGIYSSGAADLLVDKLLRQPKSERGALTRLFAPVLFLSAFLNNTAVVATMIPALNNWSRKINIPASKLMIPLSYCSILGGTLTLIGTSTNLVVNAQYQALTGAAGFSLFSITAVGAVAMIVGIGFMLLAFPRLLPNRDTGKGLTQLREFTLEVVVDETGPLVGKTVEDAGLRDLDRVYLVEIERNDTILTAVASEEVLKGGDRLIFTGDTEAISDLLRIKGVRSSAETTRASIINEQRGERCLVEAVVSPHCGAIGETIRHAKFRDRYGAVVLAVAREGERVTGNLGNIRLTAGDTLLLEARPAFVTRQRYNKDFLLVHDLDRESPRHERAYLAWAILAFMVLSVLFEVFSMLNAALIAASLVVITGCCSVHQATRGMDLPVLTTIAASFALGQALEKTGVAAALATSLLDLSYGNPVLMIIFAYIAVSLLTEVITNNAAAILTLPIVLRVAEAAQLDPVPFVITVMMAASASFATPLGYQTNLMVYGPGGYRVQDFLLVGIPMNILVGAASITAILLLWPLR